MNTKILASIAVFAMMASIVGMSFTHSVYAADVSIDKKANATKTMIDSKVADKKAAMDKKIEDKKAAMDKKLSDKKAKIDSKIDEKKSNSTSTNTSVPPTPATSNSKDVTVEVPKGSATNQKCADQCFIPMKVSVAAGGKITWKNDDSAAHTATASDGKTFDTSLINAGSSASATFSTAGTFDYMCIVHPWMKGTVTVS